MNKPDLSQFDAILFDMDGVLVDSEPLWKIAMEEVFTALGSKLTKTDFQKTVGMRIDQVILFWKEIEGWKEQVQDIEYQIIERMVALIREEGQALPGVQDTVMHFNKIKMSTKYKFRDQQQIYFVTFTVVYWIDVFIRNDYKEILLDSWRHCIKEKGLEI